MDNKQINEKLRQMGLGAMAGLNLQYVMNNLGLCAPFIPFRYAPLHKWGAKPFQFYGYTLVAGY